MLNFCNVDKTKNGTKEWDYILLDKADYDKLMAGSPNIPDAAHASYLQAQMKYYKSTANKEK